MIVIPEGVEALYRSRRKDDHGHDPEMAGWVGGALLVGFIIMFVLLLVVLLYLPPFNGKDVSKLTTLVVRTS